MAWARGAVDELHCIPLEGQAFGLGLAASFLPPGTVVSGQQSAIILAITCTADEEGGPAVTAICARADAYVDRRKKQRDEDNLKTFKREMENKRERLYHALSRVSLLTCSPLVLQHGQRR